MLVEDDNNLREIYGERLMAEGYDIISACDGEEALALAVKEKPDLIVADIMMPKISGFDMLDILRQTPETKDTKVIMMTALSQTEDKDRAKRLGANKYLVKSQVTLEDVARVVHDLVYEDQASPTEAANPASAPAAEPVVTDQTPVTPPVEPPAEPPSAPVIPEPSMDPVVSPAPVVQVPTEPVEPPASEEAPSNEPVTSSAPINPISEVAAPIDDEPKTDSTEESNSSEAISSSEESATANQQITDFVNNNVPDENNPVAPVIDPAENTDPNNQINNDDKVAEDPTIPPIVSPEDTSDQPASARKLIIQPPDDMYKNQPDLNELLQKEMAKEDSNVIPTPAAGTTVDVPAENNPISTPAQDSSEPEPLETADASQISGITFGDSTPENNQPQPPQQPPKSDPTTPPTTPSVNSSEADPDQIAL